MPVDHKLVDAAITLVQTRLPEEPGAGAAAMRLAEVQPYWWANALAAKLRNS